MQTIPFSSILSIKLLNSHSRRAECPLANFHNRRLQHLGRNSREIECYREMHLWILKGLLCAFRSFDFLPLLFSFPLVLIIALLSICEEKKTSVNGLFFIRGSPVVFCYFSSLFYRGLPCYVIFFSLQRLLSFFLYPFCSFFLRLISLVVSSARTSLYLFESSSCRSSFILKLKLYPCQLTMARLGFPTRPFTHVYIHTYAHILTHIFIPT